MSNMDKIGTTPHIGNVEFELRWNGNGAYFVIFISSLCLMQTKQMSSVGNLLMWIDGMI